MPKEEKILDVTPSKHIFEALIQDISIERAIEDLIDNSIDSWQFIKSQKVLMVNIELTENSFSITDNAGGVSFDDLRLLLSPGESNRRSEEGSIGIWGIGSKRAFFTLGTETLISTRTQEETGYIINVDDDWFRDDSNRKTRWSIPYDLDNSIKKGTTQILIPDLKVKLDKISIGRIKNQISRTYSSTIEGNKIEIKFNDELLKPPPSPIFADSEYAKPAKYITDIPTDENGRSLHFEMVVGVMTKAGERLSYGIDIIGNDRAIILNNLDSRSGFEQNKLSSPHQTINRFRAIVKLSGRSADIPWNSSKSDMNKNHPMYDKILGLIVLIAWPYTSFLRRYFKFTSGLFKSPILFSEIDVIKFKYGTSPKNLVNKYKLKDSKDENISFSIGHEELHEIIDYFGLKGKSNSDIGRFLFDRTLNEIRGVGG